MQAVLSDELSEHERHWVAILEQSLMDEPVDTLRTANADAGLIQDPERSARLFAVRSYSVGLGIALAGAAYPSVAALANLILTIARVTHPSMVYPTYHSEFEESLRILFFSSTIGAGLGLVWATIVCAAILPLVYLIVLSLRVRASLTGLGAFAGGLVGFIAFLPLCLDSAGLLRAGPKIPIIPLIFGPALTTILGQLGGAWGARRVGRYERTVAQALVRDENKPQKHGGRTICSPSANLRFQFGIRHLLWVAIWLNLLLTAIRLVFGSFAVLPLLVAWLAYQTATMWIGDRLIRACAWFRQHRQSCST